MSRLRGPLFSLGATGRLSRALTLARRLTGPAWLLRGRPANPNTPPQQEWRHMYQKAVALWIALSTAEQYEWERDATKRHMTGFAWFMSQALRPNPGLYLPLQGGTMTGVIDMQGNQVHGLPAPVHVNDAARKAYVDAKVREEVTRPGARVHRTTNQTIPDDTTTTIIFNTENYDNDDMWEGVTNPDRITIQTAGIYLIIGQVHWAAHAVAARYAMIWHSTGGTLAQWYLQPQAPGNVVRAQVSTTWDCATGTYFELRVFQFTGAPLDVFATPNQSPVLQAVRIG